MATKTGKSKQKKQEARVDFTPMVDMMMLLITFFMLCTTLSKPQSMELSMPSNDKNIQDDERDQVKASQAVTVLLDGNDKIYYYEGQPNLDDPKFLKELTWTKGEGGKERLRDILDRKNHNAKVAAAKLFQEKKEKGEAMPDSTYRNRLKEIKGGKETPTVIIRATSRATYNRLVETLDEMLVNSVGKYVLDKMNDTDLKLMSNYTGQTVEP